MIIVRIRGGLGNQLFQCAIGYSLSKNKNTQMGVDISSFTLQNSRSYRLDCLNFSCINIVDSSKLPIKIKILNNRYINKVMRIKKKSIIKINANTLYVLENQDSLINEAGLNDADNLYIDGCFQTPIYFQKYRKELLKAITPNYEYSDCVKGLFDEIYKVESVAVHIRRGDFSKTRLDRYHYLLDNDYYIRAMDYIQENIECPIFYFFSDDIHWVEERFGNNKNVQIVSIKEENSDITELMLMKACKHIITANSTFSWWAAWLKEDDKAICIVPKKQYGNIYMIPNNWIKM